MARGPGAALERAIASFFLDLHTRRHGYLEYSVPTLVNRETMTGTGQLPKFEADLFATEGGGRELFLIPTAEVPLTNLHADEILELGDLPLAYTSHTACYRSEAGSVRPRHPRASCGCTSSPRSSWCGSARPRPRPPSWRLMVGHAEACLAELGLAYRVVKLAAGDMGFSAQLTYDLEVWLPSQGRYREISSCSDCGQFQARRAGIRVREADNKRVPGGDAERLRAADRADDGRDPRAVPAGGRIGRDAGRPRALPGLQDPRRRRNADRLTRPTP